MAFSKFSLGGHLSRVVLWKFRFPLTCAHPLIAIWDVGQRHTCQPFRILRNLSVFVPCIPHSSQNIMESQILQFYRVSLDSHQMDIKSLIKGTLSMSKDDLWVVMFYTIANGACQSGTERKRLRQETDRRVEQGRGGAWGGYLQRIPKHSWMSHSGWFRIDSTKCWQVWKWLQKVCTLIVNIREIPVCTIYRQLMTPTAIG